MARASNIIYSLWLLEDDINWNFTKQEIVAVNILLLQYMNEDKSQYKTNQGR